ncbi:MAG: nuclear transport factor 2 family protein [Caulobacterales bacterium]
MTLQLPPSIAAYFEAKNQHDIDAMLKPFAEDARVKDEGETMIGCIAVRKWMEDTTRKYRVTVEPETREREGDRIVVRALVSGSFPGSPVRLTYRFGLRAEQIANLEIG